MIVNKRKKTKRKVLSFKLLFLPIVAVIVFLGYSLGGEYYREYQIQKEIDILKNDISSVEKDNYKLSQLIEYYKTDEYKEAEIRRKFNLGEDGEKMAIIKPFSDSSSFMGGSVEKNENLPNYIKWWNYFFASK